MIAAARTHIIELVKTRRKGPSGRVLGERHAIQHIIAEIELAASRAMLGRTAVLADGFYGRHGPGAKRSTNSTS